MMLVSKLVHRFGKVVCRYQRLFRQKTFSVRIAGSLSRDDGINSNPRLDLVM